MGGASRCSAGRGFACRVHQSSDMCAASNLISLLQGRWGASVAAVPLLLLLLFLLLLFLRSLALCTLFAALMHD
jgi:hypothetical protein